MMEYFSEIYGDSYRAVSAVLAAAQTPVSRSDIEQILRRHTSENEALYISERLISGQWPLLGKTETGYLALTAKPERLPLTGLQRAWLAAMVNDGRCAAFLSQEQREEITRALDINTLYDNRHIEKVGMSSDGDPYSDADYAARMRVILDAIEQRRILRITYTGGKGKEISGDFVPCRLEYSPKDEKLRLYALFIRSGKTAFSATINLGRITRISPSLEQYDGEADIDQLRIEGRCEQPAVIEITDMRNGLERFMVQFASYEKRTRYVEEEDKYICSLYYERSDETELLIRLLSFGPVVRLISPDYLVEEIRRRINKQWELMQ